MFAEWVVGLLAALIATPFAVASYVSARRPSAGGQNAPQSVRSLHRVSPTGQTHVAHHRHYHRHLAA